jgi:hypothetical protein
MFERDFEFVWIPNEDPRKTEDGIEILPWRMFCEMLWSRSVV